MSRSDNVVIAQILAAIGAILILFAGIQMIGGSGRGIHFFEFDLIPTLELIVWGILSIILGIVILLSALSGSSRRSSIGFNAVTMIILGIIAVLFSNDLGGLLVIIAGIVLIL